MLQHDRRRVLPSLPTGWERWRELKQGDNVITFLRRSTAD
jgi:hypothetical protein